MCYFVTHSLPRRFLIPGKRSVGQISHSILLILRTANHEPSSHLVTRAIRTPLFLIYLATDATLSAFRCIISHMGPGPYFRLSSFYYYNIPE
jgi:hypothetical protein